MHMKFKIGDLIIFKSLPYPNTIRFVASIFISETETEYGLVAPYTSTNDLVAMVDCIFVDNNYELYSSAFS